MSISSVLHEVMSRTHNYTPQVLIPVVEKWTRRKHKIALLYHHSIPKIYKFRTLVVLVDFVETVKLIPDKFLLIEILRRISDTDYIFAHIMNPYSRKPIEHYYTAKSPSKLVLFSQTHPDTLVIPCISCYSETHSELESTQKLTRHHIDVAWNFQNLNLHGRLAFTPSTFHFDKEGSCRANIKYFERYAGGQLCMVYILRDKFNYTIFDETEIIDKTAVLHFYVAYFYHTLNGLSSRNDNAGLYGFTFEKFKFSIVTEFPSMANSFTTFLLPFDGITWFLLLVSIAMISCLVPISVSIFSGFEHQFGLRNFVQDQIFEVFVPLLGQSGSGDIRQIFGNQLTAVITCSTWLFGCYILMENLYQGSIFSYLTVPEFPNVPKTMNELLESHIPVLTTTYMSEWVFVNTSTQVVRQHATLQLFIIKKIRKAIPKSSQYQKSLDSLEKRLFLANYGDNKVEDIVANISESVNLLDKFETRSTFALLSVADELKLFTEPVKLLGKRFVIDSGDDTGFQTILMMTGDRNFIYPWFYLTYQRLMDSGLPVVWERLSLTASRLSRMRRHGEKMYKRYYAQLNTGLQFQPEFHECMPVSLVALRYAFTISVALEFVGMIILVIEFMLIPK